MTDHDKIIIEIARQIKNRDIHATLSDYRIFNGLLVKFIDSLHSVGLELPYWQPYFETHCMKFVLLNSSLIKEFEGINFTRPDNNKEHRTYNISALYLLARANIETFLLIKYLYFNTQNDEQGAFRHTLYEWSGLKTRQNFKATALENITKKGIEKKYIEQHELNLIQNKYFLGLPEYKRKDIIKSGRAKEISWKDIVKESGLEQNFHHSTWEFYSNYAHSEQIEAMQLKELFQDPTKLNDKVYITLNCTIIYEAILLLDLKNKYKELQTIFDALPLDQKAKIDFWKEFGTKFKM